MSDTATTPAPVAELPADLKAQTQVFRSMGIAHNLLSEGLFPHAKFQLVHDTLKFIQAVYEKSVEAAAAHKDADTVPELVEFKKLTKEEGAKDAKA